jgi:hypothetical protein
VNITIQAQSFFKELDAMWAIANGHQFKMSSDVANKLQIQDDKVNSNKCLIAD